MYKELIETAIKARKNAYCPYSKFSVGAALLSCDGRIYSGCNIENIAGTSNCAERTAIFKAVSEGVKSFDAVAIIGGPADKDKPENYCYPCGICRQVMTEFCDGDFKIICAKSIDNYELYILAELMPHSFVKGNENLYEHKTV